MDKLDYEPRLWITIAVIDIILVAAALLAYACYARWRRAMQTRNSKLPLRLARCALAGFVLSAAAIVSCSMIAVAQSLDIYLWDRLFSDSFVLVVAGIVKNVIAVAAFIGVVCASVGIGIVGYTSGQQK